ncbi:hypothetical protein XH94_24345, partial [Bradyrhizobium zhanjiangense]
RTSGENLFVVLLVMAPSSQELEPPANPGRFSPRLEWGSPDWCALSSAKAEIRILKAQIEDTEVDRLISYHRVLAHGPAESTASGPASRLFERVEAAERFVAFPRWNVCLRMRPDRRLARRSKADDSADRPSDRKGPERHRGMC